MPKVVTKENETYDESSKQLLEQIKGLLILQLRYSKVDDSAIGNVIGVKAKTVKNRYPLTKKETEENATTPQSNLTDTISHTNAVGKQKGQGNLSPDKESQ